MIQFRNWQIRHTGGSLAQQFDHLSRKIVIVGEIPDGWDWAILIHVNGYDDIIALERGEGSLSAVLTADNLSVAGNYSVQLRAISRIDHETIRYTNVIQGLYVPKSLTGVGTWPSVPTEFKRMEERLIELNRHPPKPGESGCWLLWDADDDIYVESDVPLPPGTGGITADQLGAGLALDEQGRICVQMADRVEEGNMLPVTSNAVAAQVGGIEDLLEDI